MGVYSSEQRGKSAKFVFGGLNSSTPSKFDNKLFSDIIIYRPKFFHFPNPFGRLE